MKEFFSLALIAVLCGVFFIVISAYPAQAMVPEIKEVKPYMMGPNTWLNITINHSPEDPTSDPPHYVDILLITVDDNSTQVSIGPVINSPPTDSFSWQYNLGQITDNPRVTVTAYCILDGWGPSSSPFTVPEFSIAALLVSFMLVSALSILLAKKAKVRKVWSNNN